MGDGIRPDDRPYGRHSVETLGSVPGQASFPTYYGRPALKPSHWRWLIITYFFVGGMAGASALIGGVVGLANRRRDRALVGAARYLALAGALVSPVLLIADLGRPERFYNMLRIYRGTSPMSIGSWTLVAFGLFNGLAAVCQFAADVLGLRRARAAARWLGVPGAASGALLATYTGSLLAVTSSPLWATAYRLLPATFGVSGMATASAALLLMLRDNPLAQSAVRRLERLALLVSAVELVLTLDLDRTWRRLGVRGPLDEPPLAQSYRLGVLGLGILVPLAIHLLQVLTGRDLGWLSRFASLAALVGGFTQRAVLTLAGRRSVERPTDYFRVAQRPVVPELAAGERG